MQGFNGYHVFFNAAKFNSLIIRFIKIVFTIRLNYILLLNWMSYDYNIGVYYDDIYYWIE